MWDSGRVAHCLAQLHFSNGPWIRTFSIYAGKLGRCAKSIPRILFSTSHRRLVVFQSKFSGNSLAWSLPSFTLILEIDPEKHPTCPCLSCGTGHSLTMPQFNDTHYFAQSNLFNNGSSQYHMLADILFNNRRLLR